MIHPTWSYNSVIYEMNVRQLTVEGTLRAAAGKLDFLHDMGIDAVWLMPIYPIGKLNRKGTLGSYYSIRDYCAVNEELGAMADFDAFVDKAHSLGMKVMLDWVANHTARDARWLTEKPADWYERDENGEALIPWDWSDTAKLNYANKAVWQGQVDAMKFWVTQHAVDGFRCDMAMLVPIEFWDWTSKELHSVNPDIFMLAEAEEFNLFEHRAFDACYAWELHHLMNSVAQQKCRVDVMRNFLSANAHSYPHSAMRLLFTSNHDENSWNGTEFMRMGAAHEIMAAFTFVAPFSIPLIYTGQEVGYDHQFEFFDRDPISHYQANKFTEFYRRMIALKHSSAALFAGETGGVAIDLHNNAEDCLMSFVREVGDSRVVAIMNFSPYTIRADFHTGVYAGEYTDVLTGEKTSLPEHVDRYMDAWNYQILYI